MYKVFFNDRRVFLCSPDEKKELSCEVKLIEVEKQQEVGLWVNRFLTDHTTKDVVFLNAEIELLFRWFCSCFECIGAAGGLVSNPRQELLCIKRLNYWDLPKGKAEIGESAEQTALREVEEECGISPLIIDTYATESYHIYAHPKKEGRWVLKKTDWFFINYQGHQTPTPQTSEAIEEAIWASVDEVQTIKKKTYASLMPVFELWLNSLLHSR